MSLTSTLKTSSILFLIFISCIDLVAQVQVATNVPIISGTYNPNGTFNGRNRYTLVVSIIPSITSDIVWDSGSDTWVLAGFIDGAIGSIIATNIAATSPNPPCSSFNPWGITPDGALLGLTTITVSGTSCVTLGPAPVSWHAFDGQASERGVELNWATATEINNAGFWLEKSFNGQQWEAIEFINGQGQSQVMSNYSAIDTKPFTGINYYRLKQLDFDGKYEYSRTIEVSFGSDLSAFRIYPNPSDTYLNYLLPFKDNKEQLQSISIYNSQGQLVKQLIPDSFAQKISTASLPKGVYWLQFHTNYKQLKGKFVKQ